MLDLHAQHERSFEANRFVYPVLSRRSRGISIGVNLNPDKVCNFDCIYCEIFAVEKFRDTPPELRRLNDMAFSGDGEPTTYRNFDELIEACARLKRQRGLDDVKMVLITNASMFHRPHVRRGLDILDANNGEIWAKLEAGTEAYFQLGDRTPIKLAQVVENIATAARARPLVIQSLFMRVAGQAPPAEELAAFCDRLSEITAAGGRIKLVQVYTVARRPAEEYVAPLADAEVDAIVALVRARTGLAAEPFYGGSTGD